jgi:hypothetical protein
MLAFCAKGPKFKHHLSLNRKENDIENLLVISLDL